MDNEIGGSEKGQWSPSFITLNGWVDWDKKVETMMDSPNARKLLNDIIESLPTRGRAVINEEITCSDLSEGVHHLKIVIRIKAECEERDVWPIRNRILDMA